jgi:hypothetical protein
MPTKRRRLLALVLFSAAMMTGCENTPPARDYVIPPGVSLDPPRAAPAAGGLVLPGAEGDTTARVAGSAADTAGAAVPDTAPAAPGT